MVSTSQSTVSRLLENHEAKIWFLIRLGVCAEFIGHGAFGVITKAGWLPYFAVWGIPEGPAWTLMPIVGTMDIILGLMALFAPRKALFLFMAAWGLMTAFLRPLAGEPVSELFERAYNYCVPLAGFLMILWDAKRHGWWHRVKNVPSLSTAHWQTISVMLRVAIAVYLIGHGAFGLIDGKAGLATHYDNTGISALFGSTAAAMSTIGGFEMLLGLAVLIAPVAPLLFFVCGWKIFSESLFIFSGAFFGGFEFIERGASMVAPIALYYILRVIKERKMSRSTGSLKETDYVSAK
ncbi:MAG: hypothetical protein AAF152_08485 [Cyanobacteria bacterium P01_A01_bin.114]